jgi:S-DNA-T family DNA segregation ATPase FtsK/SpoIIIE
MNRRYKVLQEHRFRNIEEYNNSTKVKNKEIDKLPYIVFIVDEYAELMCSTGGSDKKKALETHIQSLTQKARAAGIHLVLATQRPSRDVVTGTIKSNLPAKIAFKVASGVNSQVILDRLGAEALVGRGDMLFLDPTSSEPIRVQGAYVENEEVQNIVEYIKEHNDTDFSSEFENSISEPEPTEEDEIDEAEKGENSGGALDGYDKDIESVARAVLKSRNASGSMIQRKFNMGYVRAVKIVDQLEELGCIGPLTASNKREVLLTNEKFKEIFGKDPDDESYD